MIKNINFNKLLKPLLIINAAVFAVGVIMLAIFGGNTFAEYTLNNIRTSLIVKIFVFAALVVLFTTLYFFIRFKKKGLWLGLFAGAGAAISALVSFAFCVIFRAPLCEITLALVLFSAIITYITSLVFANKLNSVVIKKNTDKSELYSKLARDTFSALLLPVILLVLVAVIGFVVALIYSASLVYLYAFPVVLSVAVSVITAISFTCNLYFKKI